MYIDIYYIILVVPTIILTLFAQIKVKSTFTKYSAIPSRRGLTGREAARIVLDYKNLADVQIERVSGSLTDHYDPSKNVLRLSESVYDSSSVAAIAVACHEAGHAVQKSVNYKPLVLRSTLVPLANIGSNAGPWLVILGLIFSVEKLLYVGICLFALSVLFYLVTLPVEFNASKRALNLLEETHIVESDEIYMARSVLGAAAMTYVASALTSLANLLRFILIARSRNDRR